MNSLFKPITLRWWQVSVVKISLLSLGIYIGATWTDIFEKWTTILLAVFIVTAFYLIIVWWKQWHNIDTHSSIHDSTLEKKF
ncbi:MAG: hypothetical protein COU90_02520 [Candidatus Ryanbacteria bacterium CG10_big_fil_rev_8_21_14_0_10_43_42]|uniref:Uncharacterized protein n=1 Tax=Candidatus Ryanbacteria bacterium CG10_big_fil_rev_8_21_14_0_10_43_42 TaxID=1974864 RepID=A0A2M8KWM7_9BACT|nr:MAG: hypothetical protein COU90_02520 [Candidatus Ryanbacteria bacterium CG10_big_fil_rev_8_21_14_0_10_43_42]